MLPAKGAHRLDDHALIVANDAASLAIPTTFGTVAAPRRGSRPAHDRHAALAIQRATTARPIPEPLPVTGATWPSSHPMTPSRASRIGHL
jgi:hypothetical protein